MLSRNVLWKTLLTLWICCFAGTAFAQNEFDGCGLYEVYGTIRKTAAGHIVLINTGATEVQLSLDSDLNEVASVFVDKSVTIDGRILSPLAENRGLLQSSKSAKEIADMRAKGKPYSARFERNDIRDRTPDPLHPEWEAGFKLVNKLPCGKKK